MSMSTRHDTTSLKGQIARQAFLIVVTFLTLCPVLWVVKIALSPSAGLPSGVSPIPTEVTFDHFAAVLGRRDQFGQAQQQYGGCSKGQRGVTAGKRGQRRHRQNQAHAHGT